MIYLRRNETVDGGNRKLSITLFAGATPIIPADLRFAIFEINSPEKVVSPIKVFPVSSDMQIVDTVRDLTHGGSKVRDGEYCAIFQVPHDITIGRCRIVWYYKTDLSQPTYLTFLEEFETIDYVQVYGSGGPPLVPISEIRTFLRDNPEMHVLVDNFLFSDNDIMTAAEQTVARFNRINPPIGEYMVQNFPDRYLLTIGIASWLFQSEANKQLMEQITYQDGNIHHGITDKTQLYREAAAALNKEFMDIAKEVKMYINMNQVYDGSGVGVRYRYNRYYGRRLA